MKITIASGLPHSRISIEQRSVKFPFSGLALPAAGLLWMASSPLSRAALPITEPFAYPAASDIALKSGGQGWSGAWIGKTGNGNIKASSNSLAYPGIASTGGKFFFDGTPGSGTNTFLFRNLDTPLIEGNTYYIRFLAQNINEGRQYFGLALYSQSSGEELLIGQSSYSPNWTVNRLSGLDDSAGVLVSEIDSSAMSLLVVKLEMLPGAERVTFWVNPNLALGESSLVPQGGSFFTTKEDLGDIETVRVGGGGYRDGVNPTDHFMDEIHIDTKSPFADTRDTDLDGLSNYQETVVHKTDPSKPDTDGDGVKDGVEVADGTKPLVPDSDGDSLKDGLEKSLRTNPLVQDSDGDDLNDGVEKNIGTNPLVKDTDLDGYTDGYEVANRSDPKSKTSVPTHAVTLVNGGKAIGGTFAKSGSGAHGSVMILTATAAPGYVFTGWTGDLSGKTNPSEVKLGSPKRIGAEFAKDTRDQDDDGLNNFSEIVQHETDPKDPDTDGDKFSDGEEVLERGSDPTVFNKAVTSSLATLKLKKGKLMPRYMVTTNIGAKTFTAEDLPPGLKLAKTTGVLSGTATKTGTYKVTLIATKSKGVSVKATLTITVS